MEGCPSFWGLAVGEGASANFPIANMYIVTGMDSAADLTTGVWVEVVAIFGIGAVEFTGVVGVVVVGMGWAITLPLYLL